MATIKRWPSNESFADWDEEQTLSLFASTVIMMMLLETDVFSVEVVYIAAEYLPL